MEYAKALQKALDEAEPAPPSLSRAELEERIAGITAQLKGPMRNVERIWLCEDRASLRKALAKLPT